MLTWMAHDTPGERAAFHEPCPLVKRMLATPEGRALNALVEAAVGYDRLNRDMRRGGLHQAWIAASGRYRAAVDAYLALAEPK